MNKNTHSKDIYVLKSPSTDNPIAHIIDKLPVRIGRMKDNDVVIHDAQVSKHHAEIFRDGQCIKIRDLGSKNHTYVNGRIISEETIDSGDRIRIAGHIYLFMKSEVESCLEEPSSTEFLRRIGNIKNFFLKKGRRKDGASGKKENDYNETTMMKEITDLEQIHMQLGTLLKISNNLTSALDIDDLLHTIINELGNVVAAEKIVIYLRDNGSFGKRIESGHVDSRDTISSSVVNKVIETKQTERIENALGAEEYKYSNSIQQENIRSILCVPIICRDELLGLIYLDNSSDLHRFDETHADLVTAVADQSAIALKNALLLEEIKKNYEKNLEIERLAAIGTFAAEIVHQIKNLLVPIQRIEEIRPFVAGDETAVSLVNSVSNSAKRFDMINNSIRRIASPRKIQPEWRNLSEIIDQVHFNCKESLEQRKADLKTNVPESMRVFVDDKQLGEALRNIVQNAIEAFEEPGGKISIEAGREQDSTVISVRDNGSGIPEEKQSDIFKLFYTTKEKKGGTGLGLPLSRAVILAHNGHIELKSEVPKGTEFLIHLPDPARAEITGDSEPTEL